MRAILRWKSVLLVSGLWLVPASALAQNTTEPATTNTPPTDTVGPRELQNFSLPGTTTRPAEQAPAAPAVPAPQPRTESSTPVAESPAGKTARRTISRETPPQAPAAATVPGPLAKAPGASAAPLLPVGNSATAALQPSLGPPSVPQQAQPTATLAPERKIDFLPWLAAALALAAGAGLLLWWRRSREAYAAAGVEFDLLAPADPTPEPQPQPQPQARPTPSRAPAAEPATRPPARPSAPVGIVASRLRPSIEIGVQPLRCVANEDQVSVEFEIELFNAGTAPARAVLAEASLLNAGATQERELTNFFANPVGAGNRLDAIPPLRRITLKSQVVAPRAAIQEYAVGGRKAFVPVIAFNALYEWSGGKGQTSAAYLVGRETGREKLGPLHIDEGAREYYGLGAHQLPTALRT